MPEQYLLHLPDGTEYGPVDRATLEAWAGEGRLPAETLVWPEGAPEWVSLPKVLAARAVTSAPASEPEPAFASSSPPQPAPASAPATAPAEPPASAPKATPRPAPAATPAPAGAAAPAPAQAASPKPVPTVSPKLAPAAKPKPAAAATPNPAPAPAVAGTASPSSPGPTMRPAAAPPPGDDRPDTVPKHLRAPRPHDARSLRARPAGAPAAARALGLTLVGIAVVVGLLAGLWAILRPFVARRRAIAEVQRYALPERRVDDREAGLAIDLPPGWVSLRPDNPFVTSPRARIRLANPAAGVFGALSVNPRPRFMDDLDGHLSELLQERLPRQPSQREGQRSDVQLGRGRARLVRTTWDDGLVPMQGATVAWADGYELFSLEAWARASAGEAFADALTPLCAGIAPKGTAAARIDEAVERLAVEVPELSREALRLLVAERLSEGRGLEDVPVAALQMVSRGLDALGAAEAAEMRTIYQQVWAPVPEAERVRLASLMSEIKAGRPIRDEDLLTLRTVVRAGVIALPEEQRSRLQELSGRAVRKSLLLR